ncbi:DUF3152 domain-containing protein [Aeromicrobium sp. REDSEA-S38_B2]|uniref:DUF3152 domain-containing protein n=1 Tax=Aeromicrobium sp. REDSEA-S38_B2 TaxID=1811528 RepID=UPI000A5F26A2|nr:DUF3152 domain-containing protein [Aeromicrobium sp. REDSEA-S38_B2]
MTSTGPILRRGRRASSLVTSTVLAFGLLAAAGPASADEPNPTEPTPTEPTPTQPTPATAVQVVEPPVVTGTARYWSTLTSTTGRYEPGTARVTRQWLRDGAPIRGATAATYRLVGADVGRRVAVRVVASADGLEQATTTTGPTTAVATAPLTVRTAPRISGTRRYGQVLQASAGRWSSSGLTKRYQWYRDRTVIRGATQRRYAIAPADVGHRLRVRVTVSKAYHRTSSATAVTAPVRHRRDARRTLTYSVRSDGARGSLATFRRQAAQTLADARGWPGAGVRFREVRSGGDFTLVLARASRLTSYSTECSVLYSCRVGRNVIINEDRWVHTTRVWRSAKGSVRDYRHMVVNHEVGHFLGRGHLGCPGRGQAAPIMQQQSKGLHGCRVNPWPRRDEL